MTDSTPFFSIITAVYNNPTGLERTIKSVITQNFRNFEFIVIDGGSQDGTQKVIEKYAQYVTYWVSEKDFGIYHAWNKGVRQSKGQWISFLGSGDIFFPDALSNYHQFISSNQQFEFVSSRVNLVRNNKLVRTIGLAWSWPAFLKIMTVAHVGSMHHINLYAKYGLYDETYKITADYEFLLRAGDQLSAGYMKSITAEMVMGGISSNWRKVFKETYRAKIQTGKKPIWKAQIEDWEAKCKYLIRSFLIK